MTEQSRARWLAEPDWLAAHLEDPAVRIVDMRGVVRTTTDEDGTQHAAYLGLRDEYLAGHIPGAVFLDWTTDITDPDDPVPAQVAPPKRIAAVLGAAGISDDTTVVAYDAHPSSQFATRLWWVLRYYGHDAVKVLNGGWPQWQREGRPVSTAVPVVRPATFTPRVRPELRASAEQVLAALGQPAVTLADARDTGQYTNAVRRGSRGGHIPGALSIPRESFIDDSGRFRGNADLQAAATASGLNPDHQVIAYCNGGVAATTVLFGLSLLDYPRLTNYDGSWNEWSERPELPVEF
ncbi:MAG: sulfurtransferase [Chloroflexi bacterium]|nr:sulfurtransferase [Chloroflexota bacterium]